MDFAAYTDAAVSGVPLLFVVLGLVEWVKGFGVNGKSLRVVSMVIGLALGIGYMFSTMGVPGSEAGFSPWFSIVVFGLGLGLVASGIYDVGRSLTRP